MAVGSHYLRKYPKFKTICFSFWITVGSKLHFMQVVWDFLTQICWNHRLSDIHGFRLIWCRSISISSRGSCLPLIFLRLCPFMLSAPLWPTSLRGTTVTALRPWPCSNPLASSWASSADRLLSAWPPVWWRRSYPSCCLIITAHLYMKSFHCLKIMLCMYSKVNWNTRVGLNYRHGVLIVFCEESSLWLKKKKN